MGNQINRTETRNIADLKGHKLNNFYFDNMEDGQLADLMGSINKIGLLTPITINENNIIISGHQRYNACKKLGLSEVSVEVIRFKNEDEEICALIDANVKSRGGLSTKNIMKAQRVIEFLKDFYNIDGSNKGGRPKEETGANAPVNSVNDLSDYLKVSKKSMIRYDQYNDLLIQQLQDLFANGDITPKDARTLIKYVNVEEQDRIYRLGEDYIKSMKNKLHEIPMIASMVEEMKPRVETVEVVKEVVKTEIKEVVKEVIPNDYETLKIAVKGLTRRVENADIELSSKKKQYEQLKKSSMETESQLFAFNNLKKDIENLAKEKENFMQELDDIGEISRIATKIEMVIEKELSPLKYSRSLSRMKDDNAAKDRIGYLLNTVVDWVTDIEKIINGGVENGK